MARRLPWVAAAIIVVAGVAAWALWPAAKPVAAPGWHPITGYVPNQGGIIAIYAVKTTTNLNTDPATWTSDNYYDKITAAGTLDVPTLTDFYIVVEARGESPYVVGLNTDNIIVEGFADTLRENMTGTAFVWYTVEGTENIRVSAAFDENGGVIDDPWNLTGETEFAYTVRVYQWY
jgi:hypothetical protein